MKQGASERVAASLAHHIRTPLATALLYLRLIEDELGPGVNRELRDGLVGARDEMQRLDRLLGMLVDYHRLGRLVVEPAMVDAGRVAADALAKALRAPLPAEVELDVSAGDLTDWWDAAVLEEIVQSLISNIVQQGHRLTSIDVGRADRSLRLNVRSDGRTSARERARMFSERLTIPRAKRSTPQLELWLVGRLASAHGGEARAEIDRDGGGTVVTVTLAPAPPAP